MSGAATMLGSFAVVAQPGDVAAFRAATGLVDASACLPLTFPMRWMASPAVRAALLSLIPEGDLVPVHEAQSFDYATPLHEGIPYTLRLEARRETAPDRLVAAGTIVSEDGTPRATLETILRLFSTAAA